MKIINPILIFLSFGGLSFENIDSKFQKCLYLFWSSCSTVFVFGLWIYLYENLSHLSTVFNEFVFGIGVSMVLVKAFLYNPSKKKYLHLYNKLQNNAILRTKSGSKCFQLAEKQSKYFFACTGTLTCFTGSYMIIVPLIMILYKHINGTLKPADIVQPVPTSYYIFDNKYSPAFEINYIIFIISWCGCCIFSVGIDSLFIGIGFHIVAGFKDLQIMLLHLDDIIKSNSNNNRTMKKSIKFFTQLVNCIEYQKCMLEYQNNLQEINSTIIFTTAVGVSLILCSDLFRLTRATSDELLLLIVLTIALNVMLLAYIYVGHLITTEGLNVAKTAYNGLWYLCSARERRLYLQLIQFSQKTRFINGLYFFDCSMETFSKIIQASFSFTAVMRNLG